MRQTGIRRIAVVLQFFLANKATNTAEARRALREWAAVLRTGLDSARGAASWLWC